MDKKSKSSLPDKFQMTDGTNYGLDGFQFDSDYGGAVAERARLPEAKGLSALPQDLITTPESSELPTLEKKGDDEGLGDLSSMLAENSLAELGWLHGHQDPDRLPKNPVDRGIMELEKAWGADRPTNGLVPNVDRHVSPKPKQASDEVLNEVVFLAHRMSALGKPIENILHECEVRLGSDIALIREDLEVIKSEHGLAGNVFVYANAFKGIQNGRWKTLLKKLSSCRYLVGADKSLQPYTRLEIVDEVPWKVALAHYAPRLEREGKKFAKNLNPKETLRQAFLSSPQDLSPKLMKEIKPVEVRPADTISAKEAFERLPSMKQARIRVDMSERQKAQERKKTQIQIAKWVSAGFFTKEQGVKLGSLDLHPDVLHKQAWLIVHSLTQSEDYSGVANSNSISTYVDRAIVAIEQQHRRNQEMAEQMQDNRVAYILGQIDKWKEKGLLSEKEHREITTANVAENHKLRMASEYISKRMRTSTMISMRSKTAKYSGEENNALGTMSERTFEEKKKRVALEEKRHRNMLANQLKFAKDQVTRWAKRHLLTEEQANTLIATTTSGEELLYKASMLIASIEVGEYKGTGETRHIEQPKPRDVQAESSRVAQSKLAKVTTWIRRQMCEGMIGDQLTQLLQLKFAKPFLERISSEVASVRKAHEGLSGNVYVDAEAYASTEGTRGCDEGARLHRANRIARLKAMSRCSTCVFANRTPSGEMVCQKYNKILMKDIPIENRDTFQSEVIRLANASDAEVTASLFAPSYENDFHLGGSEMDSISFNDIEIEGSLDGIFFGGFEV